MLAREGVRIRRNAVRILLELVSGCGRNMQQPDKQVDLKKVEQLPESTTVNLNQYNVFVYKKVIRGVNVYPDLSKLAQGKFKLDEVTADVNRRITKDGKYLGVVAGYDFKYDHAKAGIRYSF